MSVRTAAGSIAAMATVGALVAGGAGTAAAAGSASFDTGSDSGSASVSESLGSSGSEDGSSNSPGSSASTASSQIENAWQQFVDAGVQITVDTGSLGVWDTGSLGLDHNAPGMETSFDDKGRLNVTVTRPSGIGTLAVCTTALIDARVLPSIADDPIEAITSGGEGISLLVPPNPLKLSKVRTLQPVDPGVYALATVCLPQGGSDIAVELMVVPDTGVGSVEQVVGFGSDAGSLGLEQLLGSGSSGSASSDGGSGSGSSSSDSGSGSGSGS